MRVKNLKNLGPLWRLITKDALSPKLMKFRIYEINIKMFPIILCEIQQTFPQQCCISTCQIAERCDNLKTQYCGFKTSRDLAVRHLTGPLGEHKKNLNQITIFLHKSDNFDHLIVFWRFVWITLMRCVNHAKSLEFLHLLTINRRILYISVTNAIWLSLRYINRPDYLLSWCWRIPRISHVCITDPKLQHKVQ